MNPDFIEKNYTAELLKVRGKPDKIWDQLLKNTHGRKTEAILEEESGHPIRIVHSYVASDRQYHRSTRLRTQADGSDLEIPRKSIVRGREQFLYDVLIAQRNGHIVVAVPFFQLAEQFFINLDRSLSGTGTLYERIDINRLVLKLGAEGQLNVNSSGSSRIVMTRCHLAYSSRDPQIGSFKQIQMTGFNLGACEEYKVLVAPVLKADKKNNRVVTPLVCGFALIENGIKRSSAITDKHGNFKVWIAPGARRLIRLFSLLAAVEAIEDIALTTSNIPILQSKSIESAGE